MSESFDERGLPPHQAINQTWEVTPAEVREARDDPDTVLIDCRTPEEHEFCRIQGAQLVPLQELAQRLDEFEDHADKRIIVYCHHGRRSLQAAAMIRATGFENTWSMAGGIDQWSLAIDSAVPRY